MLVAEMARPKQKCMVACPTHKVLAEQMHVSTRSVERQFAALVETGWLERVGPRAQRGTAQSYQLRVPNSITPELAELAHSLAPGMWQRLKNYPQPDTP
jgi:DNA-binding transcriptional MocR family regulator